MVGFVISVLLLLGAGGVDHRRARVADHRPAMRRWHSAAALAGFNAPAERRAAWAAIRIVLSMVVISTGVGVDLHPLRRHGCGAPRRTSRIAKARRNACGARAMWRAKIRVSLRIASKLSMCILLVLSVWSEGRQA